MKKATFIILLCCACHIPALAQDGFDEFRQNLLKDFSAFRTEVKHNYNSFRDSINQEFAKALQNPWQKNLHKDIRPIPDKELPPVVPRPLKKEIKFNHDLDHRSVTVAPIHRLPVREEVKPVVPVEPKEEPHAHQASVPFLGSILKVRIPSSLSVSLQQLNERGVSRAWSQLSDQLTDNTLHDCLAIRRDAHLCDWAYFQFLDCLAQECFPHDRNLSTLLHAYLYCQSGYKMRLAYGGSRLFLLFASRHKIYNLNYYIIDNESFYPYQCNESSLKISKAKFPKEQPLSLVVTDLPRLKEHPTSPRSLQARPTFRADVRINKDLIEFFNHYPSSSINNNTMTRWMMYADTPLSQTAQSSFYPAIRQAIQGKSTVDAVQFILTLVQRAFPYGYDNQIWGSDRAFFAEETLHYPYSDCEDHAILFTRILRDLLHVKCALVYSPGHLYTAVQLPPSVKGHTIHINNERYVICDPTYEGANIGVIMPMLKDKEKQAIPLR